MDMFHMLGIHPGVHYVPPRPGWVMRPAERARIRGFAASENNAMRAMQQESIENLEDRLMDDVMEINTAPVVLEDARFVKDGILIAGRALLNGASGDRLRRKYDLRNPGQKKQDRLADAFRRAKRQGEKQLPVWKDPCDRFDIAIDVKNGFNYYHFTQESLGSLAHFATDDSGRPINLHFPPGDVRSFVMNFVTTIFPQLADRVRILSRTKRYDHVRSVFSHRHYLYQVADERIPRAAAVSGEGRWQRLRHEIISRRKVMLSSYDSNLRLLREHALRHVSQSLVSSMPRLVWMGRDESGDARARGISGHQALLEELTARGFETVVFEHLTPAEQIAAMQAADIVIAPHGAGLVNMVYARPDTLVIEIGSRQSQLHRWGVFHSAAHVSRCRYDAVFADSMGDTDPERVPPISQGLLGVQLGPRAIGQILQILDQAMEPAVLQAAHSAA
ncbi:hypothetical protein IT41_12755 [Paracoccus halophilus]|nr:hypothetical protein IT41_12755 [Paracoccus halophilus]